MADVKYGKTSWENMHRTLGNLLGAGAFGDGVFTDLKKVTKKLEKAEEKINEYDEDNIISFEHTNLESKYEVLCEKFNVLKDFSKEVHTIVAETIDDPFYKKIDDYVETLEGLSITEYTTKNNLGITQPKMKEGPGGSKYYVDEKKKEITLDDIMKNDNPVSLSMKTAWEQYQRNSPEDEQLTYDEYVGTYLNQGAFNYESIRDKQLKKEMWVNIGLTVLSIGVGVFCPPAGAALGIALGALNLASAGFGKDFYSGRELSNKERIARAGFGLLSMGAGTFTLLSFSKNVSLVQGTERWTLSHAEQMLKNSSRANFKSIRQQANALKALQKNGSAFGEMNLADAKRYNQYWEDVSKGLDTNTRVKLNQWEYRPSADLYNKYKGVYDNPKYYDQTNGNIHWPENDGFVSKKLETYYPGQIVDRYGESNGSFLGNFGDPYPNRALAPHSENATYYTYEVIQEVEVTTGEIAPWFDQPGGGTQIVKYHSNGSMYTIQELIEEGFIVQIRK